MEDFVFPSKLSFTRSVLRRSSGLNFDTTPQTSTARCLFGPPDANQARSLVRQVELSNAVSFGKRFNFDVVVGEPFPAPKRQKLDDSNDNSENNGYTWSEKYNEDFTCNKSEPLPPNRHSVSLLVAPIYPVISSPIEANNNLPKEESTCVKENECHHQPSAKKSSRPNLISKYTNRVIKHGLMKPRKSMITGKQSFFFSIFSSKY